MAGIVASVAPIVVFVFAVQQALEFMDSFVSLSVYQKHKKIVLKTASFLFGALIAGFLNVRVLAELGLAGFGWIDIPVTALIVGAGTESTNSILKLLTYAKQGKKAMAAQSVSAAGDINLERMDLN